MQSHCPLPHCQSAYREFHSTETTLLTVQSDIRMNMDKKLLTLLVAMDLSAAFNLVDHGIWLEVLSNKFGIVGRASRWLTSYLNSRNFCVNIHSTNSDLHILDCSMSQGSCLGPQLFTQYASILFETLSGHLPHLHGYADDHLLQMSFSSNVEGDSVRAITAMENCLRSVKYWMLRNKLKMSDTKTELLNIRTKQQLAKTDVAPIVVGKAQVHTVDCIGSLRVYLDKHLNTKSHINTKVNAAYKHLYRIRCIRKNLAREVTECSKHAFVTSQLDYGNSLYVVPKTELLKFQRVQNQAAKLVASALKYDRVTPIMLDLHWLPVEQRIIFKIALITFKIFHSMAPMYLSDMMSYREHTYETKSSAHLFLDKPRTNCITLGDRPFAVSRPTVWNSLPVYIRSVHSLYSFKNKTKKYFLVKTSLSGNLFV